MTTTYREILPGVNLRVIETDRFKTSCFSVSFLTPLQTETAALSALIPQVLRRGSRTKPNMTDISAALDTLYGARVEPLVRKKGDIQAAGLICDLIAGNYTPDGDVILSQTLALALEILCDPLVNDGGFLEEYVNSERENLIDQIRSELNEKLQYAYRHAVANTYPNSGFGVHELGDIEILKKITPQSLYAYYEELLKSATIELFFCGNYSFDAVRDAILPMLQNVSRTSKARILPTRPMKPQPNEVVERLELSQADLLIGLYTDITISDKNQPDMQILSTVLGGGTASKLFVNVRERESLCYFTGALYDKFLQTIFLYSGVDPEKIEKARGEMLKQLAACQKGDICEEELNFAKRRIIDNLKTIGDSAVALESYWLGEAIAHSEDTPEDMIRKIRTVTIDGVKNVANTLVNVITYVLTGKEDHHAGKRLPGNQ